MRLGQTRSRAPWLLRLGGVLSCSASTLCCAAGAAPPSGLATVERRTLEDVFLLTGELTAVRSELLTVPAIDQAQIKWLAPDGSRVAEGERVAEFDDAGLLARLDEQRTMLAQAQIARESRERELAAERDTKRALLENAGIEVEKARLDADVPRALRSQLEWRDFQAVLAEKQAELEKARLAAEAFEVAARADLLALDAAFHKASRTLERAEEVLESVSLEAPRAGLFVVGQHRFGLDRKLQPGDNVFTGMEMASIPDPSEMEVSARLPEVDWGRIEPGQPARVILDTWTDRVFEGRVEDVTPVASRVGNLSGYAVRVSLARTEPELMRPGLSVRLEVRRARWEGVLCVARAAVRLDGEQPEVVSVGGDVVDVELHGCTPTWCAIASGLEEGDRVRVF